MTQFNPTQELIDNIRGLQVHPWYKMFLEWLQEEIEEREQIILKVDTDLNETKFNWHDIIRAEREFMLDIKKFASDKLDELDPVIETSPDY